MLLYLSLTKLSWADGTDPDLLRSCLESTYESWIGLFTSILSTEASKIVGQKMQVFRVSDRDQILCVIFRDLKEYAARSMQQFIFLIFRCLKNYLPLFIWYGRRY